MIYLPLESILYDLSLSMDPSQWNNASAKEFALSALRSIGGLSLYSEKIEYFQVTNHKLKFPEGLRILNQSQVYVPSIANTQVSNEALLERIQRRVDSPHTELFLEGSYGYNNLGPYGQTLPASSEGVANTFASKWKVIYKSTNTFCSACDPHNPSRCVPEYRQSEEAYTFSFKEGIVCLSYKAFAENGDGFLIPDIQSLKEALRYYILYRIYESKCREEQTQFNISERDRSLKLYGGYRLEAVGKIAEQNLDLGTMENLKMQNQRFIRGNQFAKGFTGLNQPDQSRLF